MKKKITALVGVSLAILVISVILNIYYINAYHNSSQTLTGRIQGATLEVTNSFYFSLHYASEVLESDANTENIDVLIQHFRFFLFNARFSLPALRSYLLPSYEDSLLVIEDLLLNMTYASSRSIMATFSDLSWNISLKVIAFEELGLIASDKIDGMGFELREAFVSLRSNGIVKTFEIIPSRIENAVLTANNLKVAIDEWIAKYSLH